MVRVASEECAGRLVDIVGNIETLLRLNDPTLKGLTHVGALLKGGYCTLDQVP